MNQEIKMTEAERLLTILLTEIAKSPARREMNDDDLDLISNAVRDGHTWALREKFPGIFSSSSDDAIKVEQVKRNFAMFSFVERAVSKFTPAEKKKFEAQVETYDTKPSYRGYDGNNEDEYGIACFMVEELGYFSEFKGRDHNSHSAVSVGYFRMEQAFRPMLNGLQGRNLTPDEVALIVNAKWV